jgi:DNA-binding transcriptional LysR family regulator
MTRAHGSKRPAAGATPTSQGPGGEGRGAEGPAPDLAAALDPRRLLTFREVAHRGSFSRAAEALALTQPAVSQQLAALERQLGARLLDRGPGGVAPTALGSVLLAHADALADRLALAGAQVSELVGAEVRRLRIGAFPSALATIVPAAIARLRGAAPELELSVVEGSSPDLAAQVGAGELHLAVCFQDASLERREHPGTHRHDLLEEPMVAALPPDHRLAQRSVIHASELAEDVWTMPSSTGLIARFCAEQGFEPRVAFQITDVLATRGLIASGLCVALPPRLVAREFHGVAIVPVENAPLRSLYAVTPDAGENPHARTLLAALQAEVTPPAGSATPPPAPSRP